MHIKKAGQHKAAFRVYDAVRIEGLYVFVNCCYDVIADGNVKFIISPGRGVNYSSIFYYYSHS